MAQTYSASSQLRRGCSGHHPLTNFHKQNSTAREATDNRHLCTNCDATVQRILPLSKLGGEGQRGQEWYCTNCHTFHPHYQPALYDDKRVQQLCLTTQFGADPFLGQQLLWEDFEFYLQHLPRHKSAGSDGVPYEILSGASSGNNYLGTLTFFQHIIFVLTY